MKFKDITSFICGNCKDWVDGRKCGRCGRKIQPGDSCSSKVKDGTTYGCYRPPRPRGMTPVQYYRRFKCVDDGFDKKSNGRYFCNPAHCKRSWKIKKERDAHLKMAYAALG